MKVLTYNVWDGADGRVPLIADVIRAQRPDAVALQEVADPSAVETLARELTMHAAFGEANGPLFMHIAWLTRLPIRRATNHRLPALAKTLLEIQTGPLTMFATHLASRHEVDLYPQAGEVQAILHTLGARTDGPHLLVGDFNALVPGDPIGTPPPGVVPRGDAVPGALRPTLRPILEAGYVDCYRVVHPREPGFTWAATHPWLRLDYVFASPELAPRLRGCDVVCDARTIAASDHLPVSAEFD